MADSELLNPYADGNAPNDVTVTSIDEDRENPGWSFVSFSDGSAKTLRTEEAQQLPQPAPTPLGPDGSVVPGQEPLLPSELAQTGAGLPEQVPQVPVGQPDSGAFWGEPEIDAGPPLKTPGEQRGMAFYPAGQTGITEELQPTAPQVGTGTAQVSPSSEIVAPAGAGGAGGAYAPFSRQYGADVTTDRTADTPEEMQARLETAADAAAKSQYDQAVSAYNTTTGALEQRAAAERERQTRLERERRKQELVVEEQQKVIKAMEDNPLDEDAFWSEAPGRKAAAWIALALSGFLQGISRGQNPALNQMMGALQGAKESYMRRQQAERDSILKRREAAIGDARTAMTTLDMQIEGAMTKYADLQAQKAGVPLPPSLDTVRAQNQLKIAEGMNQIGAMTVERATRREAEEQRAVPAHVTPLRRGDVVLQQLGLDRKAVDSAFDPNDGNVPGTVSAAERLQEIKTELTAIAKKYGGDLPQQNLISWDTIGGAALAARTFGDKSAADQLRARGLISEVEQMVKQSSGTTKLWDSNQEREDLLRRINTGEGATTLEVVNRLTERANQNAVSAAQRYTNDPQGLIDFIRLSRQKTPGVDTQPVQPSRRLAPGQPGQAPQEGAAAPPLAQPGPSPAVPAARSAASRLDAVRRALGNP
jgi:hypothetical protein